MVKFLASAALFLCCTLAQAFAPQPGIWIISSEVDGKPGRGLGLDMQGDVVVLQVYAYQSNGDPLYYLGNTKLTSNSSNELIGDVPLLTYRGGRYFGSGALSATVGSNVGNAHVRFTSGTAGYITFPGETERPIIRFNYAYNTSQDSLLGTWLLSYFGSSSGIDVPILSVKGAQFFSENGIKVGTGMVYSSDSQYGCENITSGSFSGWVFCIKVNTSGTAVRYYSFIYSVNDGEGTSATSLSTLFSSTSPVLVARRILTSAKVGTGVYFVKNTPIDDAANKNTRSLDLDPSLGRLDGLVLNQSEK